MTKTQLTGVAGWLVGVVPMMILPAMSENMTAQPSVALCGQQTFGHTDVVHVVFPNVCLCVLTASKMATMKVNILI